jgi:hypothetical protein
MLGVGMRFVKEVANFLEECCLFPKFKTILKVIYMDFRGYLGKFFFPSLPVLKDFEPRTHSCFSHFYKSVAKEPVESTLNYFRSFQSCNNLLHFLNFFRS